MVNAGKSVSSCQLGYDLELNQKAAWFMQKRIPAETVREEDGIVLQGIVETDEYTCYRSKHKTYRHSVITHAKRYVEGFVHTNSIESFWALVKRAWYGTHHHYPKGYMPSYMAESCWKYNQRKNEHAFTNFIKGCVA